ncbi:MAG TPA: PIN domain-containing protein, partial [Lacipirellulaceae bacterium]|nr:PIN domain-containing protein [Lacipirellulaceae bacterium]
WFAASVPSDPNYQSDSRFLAVIDPILLVTTDYVPDEYLTLLKARGQTRRVDVLGRQILEQVVCRIEWVEPNDVYKAWTTFDSYRDKGWSFTDCVSCAVMERLQIAEAFAFDQHFREFGNVTVAP